MMKQEFEKLIGKEVSEEDYSLIDRVYTFHPAISETEGKKQIAILYNAGGMSTIRSMLETTDIMLELEKELSNARMILERVKTRIQNVKENGIEYEQCRRDMLAAFDKAASPQEWDFAKKLIVDRYERELVEQLNEELKLG